MVKSKLLEAMKLAELESVRRGEPQRWSISRLARESGLARTTVERMIDNPAACSLGVAEKIARTLGLGFDSVVSVEGDNHQGQQQDQAE